MLFKRRASAAEMPGQKVTVQTPEGARIALLEKQLAASQRAFAALQAQYAETFALNQTQATMIDELSGQIDMLKGLSDE